MNDMSADAIDAVVLLFPNQEWGSAATDDQLDAVVAQLRPNISYSLSISDSLQTLSTQTFDRNGHIAGLLYVPDLNRDDPCYELSKDYVPANVTRQANLPPTDFTLVALAPWINAECTHAYLAAARFDPMRGFIFYLPGGGSSQPPPPNSSAWDLGDGDRWKSDYDFPVYAVPSDVGQEMIHQSSLYSGNITNVPYGHDISELSGIDPRDYVRIYADITLRVDGATPSLWNLLLAIVGILLLMLALTSATMHLILRSRRKSLQRRVANGEVNLEALGIKRLTVPRDVVDKLPLFTYNMEDEDEKLPKSPKRPKKNSTSTTVTFLGNDEIEGSSSSCPRTSTNQQFTTPSSPSSPSRPIIMDGGSLSTPESNLIHKYLPYSQPTCPICLDDFESGETAIRELPCGHIYHPTCIDSFLCNNSSLCPLCKKSVLPKGYCAVEITNAMVRRELNIRQLRSRVTINDDAGDIHSDNHSNAMQHMRSKFRSLFRPNLAPLDQERSMVPLAVQPAATTNHALPDPHVSILGNIVLRSIPPGLSRQEIAQQRMRELATRPSLEEREAFAERCRPVWRKQLSKVFPRLS